MTARTNYFLKALLSCAFGACVLVASTTAQAPAKSPSTTAPLSQQQSPAKKTPPAKKPAATQPPAVKPDAGQLLTLSRTLREKDTVANYERLAAFARAHAKTTLGNRAALALGYRDFTKKRYDAARQWLAQAEHDPMLRGYALYWSGQNERAAGRRDAALLKLEQLRKEFPEYILSRDAVQALAETALEAGNAQRALSTLDGFSGTESDAELLWLRARGREAARLDALAAQDYARLYTQFPLSNAADAAEERLLVLDAIPGTGATRVTPEQRVARAEVLFAAGRWRQARAEFEKVLRALNGGARGRVDLRIAQCRANLGNAVDALAALSFADADLEAERLHSLAQELRSVRRETEMLEIVEQAASRLPKSPWTEEALFAAGNLFWAKMEHARAAEFYRRLLNNSPNGKHARTSHWRVAWAAYLHRQPQAVTLLEDFLQKFAGGEYTRDAVYFLGRAAEREGNAAHARTFYLKLRERYPQSYFGMLAAERLSQIGPGPTNSSEVLAQIPAPAPAPVLEPAIPPAAKERWERVRALRSIAFDASAELELRAAYTATGSLRLLLEAVRSAHDADRHLPGVQLARQGFPEIEARRWEEVPAEVWRALYPYAYGDSIEKFATRTGLDPWLVAGLIRQESVFQRDAVSRSGAVGLMQLLPATARQLARGERVTYSRRLLNDADFNIRLGTVHFRDLLRQFGSLEVALAAYNAGGERARTWQSKRNFEEMAEFVESIPFTETRDYVQIVLRNAEIYRRLHGKKP